jgi:proteic killer suppression protein
VRFDFRSRQLRLLYTENKDAHRYPAGVVDAFFEVIAVIKAAKNENDLRALKGLHFEKLSGERAGQYSMRINKQYRLIIIIEEDDYDKLIWIIQIEDYH